MLIKKFLLKNWKNKKGLRFDETKANDQLLTNLLSVGNWNIMF